MSVEVTPPTPKMVDVIDYDLTLFSGKEIQFTFCPSAGDTFEAGDVEDVFRFAKSGHETHIKHAAVAVWSKRPRQQVDVEDLIQQTLNPKRKPTSSWLTPPNPELSNT